MQKKEGAEAMKVLSGLVQTLLFSAVILLFIDGETGWLLMYTVLAAVVLSAVPVIFSRNNVVVSMDGFSGMTSVGEKTTARLKISKKGFCFVPFVTISGELAGQPFVAKLSLMLSSSSVVELSFRPTECGLNKITISEVQLADFFGVARFRRKADQISSIGVVPRVIEYKGPDVVPSSIPTDEEQQEESRSTLFGGMAGYEHREYAAGDSPRRINYKLSAKKRKLMVRMDESTATETTNILLSADSGSLCAEQAFALAKKLAEACSPVAVHHKGESFLVSRPESIDRLREWFAFRELGGDREALQKRPNSGTNVLISPKGVEILS